MVVDAQILAYAMSADTMLKWANSFAQQYDNTHLATYVGHVLTHTERYSPDDR